MSIKSETLAVIGIRLLVVYLVVETMSDLPSIISSSMAWPTGSEPFPMWMVVFGTSLVAIVLFAVFVWCYAEKFARRMIGTDDRLALDGKGSIDEFAEMAISITGFLIVVFSIPLLLSQTWTLYNSSAILKNVGGDIRIYQDGILSGLFVISFKIALGLMLLTTSAFWVRVLKNIREYGLKENV